MSRLKLTVSNGAVEVEGFLLFSRFFGHKRETEFASKIAKLKLKMQYEAFLDCNSNFVLKIYSINSVRLITWLILFTNNFLQNLHFFKSSNHSDNRNPDFKD